MEGGGGRGGGRRERRAGRMEKEGGDERLIAFRAGAANGKKEGAVKQVK